MWVGCNAYLFVINECHAAVCVARRADRFDYMPTELDHIAVVQMLIGLGAAALRYHTPNVGQQLLQISGAGDVVSMHMGIYCKRSDNNNVVVGEHNHCDRPAQPQQPRIFTNPNR